MQPYEPNTLPLKDLDYGRLLPLVGKAGAALAYYDGRLKSIANPSAVLSPLFNEEAVFSSKIEGIHATVGEVLEHEAGMLKEGEKANDIQEILNYRDALRSAQQDSGGRPITLSLVQDLHKILLDSVRGQNKDPGNFRKVQNWIGIPGCKMEQASFVPPDPARLPDHLEAWQKYIAEDDIDPLLQTAVMHAQFEIIHPFRDGNGRVGRILIPLFLHNKKMLSQPMFYLSAYLEANRYEYYQGLKNISRENDWNGWIAFFLQAIIEQAQNSTQKVEAIIDLYKEMEREIPKITHSQFGIYLPDAMFGQPIFQTTHLIKSLSETTEASKGTIKQLLDKLKKNNILKELQAASGRRPAILCFPRLLDITEG